MLGYLTFTLLERVAGEISYAVIVQGNKEPPYVMDEIIMECFSKFYVEVIKGLTQKRLDEFKVSVR